MGFQRFKNMMLLIVLLFCVACGGCSDDSPSEPSEADKKCTEYRNKLKSYVSPEVLATIDDEYFDYSGIRDHWRFPLVYPYSMTMIDMTTDGSLTEEANRGSSILHAVTHIAFDGKFLLAKIDPAASWTSHDSKEKLRWAVFEFTSGKYVEFNTEAEAIVDAKAKGYGGSETLEQLMVHYDRTFYK